MQSSSIKIVSKRRKQQQPSFKEYCKKLNIIHHSTRGKYKDIEKQWKLIYPEMLVDMQTQNIVITNGMELISYIQEKYNTVPYTERFQYEYIFQELTKYPTLAKEFNSHYKKYMTRLKGYAKARNCTTVNEIKVELDNYLSQFRVNADENSKHNYETQDWLIMSRYICDFLEEYATMFNEPITSIVD